ncbi:MAG: phosphoglucosamine mutase [Pirellulales bacterium]
MSELIISVSGLRGVVGDSLTPEIAVRYACAFEAGLGDGPIVIGRDGRVSGPGLSAAVCAGLVSSGRDVIDAGVAATPTLGVLVRHLRASGGIQISASHNPREYNGMKLFGPDGRVIPAEVGRKVNERFQCGQEGREVAAGGTLTELNDTTTAHCELIESIVDVRRIRRRRFKVILDANHGSGSLLGRRLLEQLGCEFEILGPDPDGEFDHPPEPIAENLTGVLDRVKQFAADIGFCQDPDADRLTVIDESGRYLGEEYTPAMCIEHALRQRKGPVVTNCSSSRMAEDIAERHGVEFFRSAVGEANVCDSMIDRDAVIGGEGNGGIIDPRVGYVRDSFVGMALLLDAMAERDAAISTLADELPKYAIVKIKLPIQRERLPEILVSLKTQFADAQFSQLDGLRLDWPDKWMLVRASNTEPAVRVIAEARDHAEASRIAAEAASLFGRA